MFLQELVINFQVISHFFYIFDQTFPCLKKVKAIKFTIFYKFRKVLKNFWNSLKSKKEITV